ncbi:putative cytoplasmic protein [Salmonella enterica subsp. enterica serovar Daytona]|uniref:Putative cytoplasmic protein n=2 Tax=Salmonella enterica TaxID=28901 RepID=A0A447JJZ7_SALET|nr:putative cytoplasmic protein [Salmonella enterica subsp. enterica serovar Daytona]
MTLQANISRETKAAKTQEVYKHVVLFKNGRLLSHKTITTTYVPCYITFPDRPLLPMLKNSASFQISTRILSVQAWNRKNEYSSSRSYLSGALLAYTHLYNI